MKTREGNPPSLRFGATRMVDGGCQARSVLECGGPPPLLNRSKDAALQSASRRRAVAVLWRAAKAEGLAQSKPWRFALVFCFLLSAFCFRAWGQSYSIDWYKIAGGGGTSAGATYQVTGTLGQPDASGVMSGGSYSLTGGFWNLFSVVQTAGLPNLSITQSRNSVIVSWANTGGCTLQQNASLALANGWMTCGYAINCSNGTNSITITPPTGNLFFRLKQ